MVMEYEMPALNDKHTQRLIKYLTNLGWTQAQIFDLIDYLTK